MTQKREKSLPNFLFTLFRCYRNDSNLLGAVLEDENVSIGSPQIPISTKFRKIISLFWFQFPFKVFTSVNFFFWLGDFVALPFATMKELKNGRYRKCFGLRSLPLFFRIFCCCHSTIHILTISTNPIERKQKKGKAWQRFSDHWI